MSVTILWPASGGVIINESDEFIHRVESAALSYANALFGAQGQQYNLNFQIELFFVSTQQLIYLIVTDFNA